MDRFIYPRRGFFTWTGEVQSIAFTTSSTAATEITIPGQHFYIYADVRCHIVLGNAGIHAASASALNRCFPVPDGDTAGPIHVYVPMDFYINSSGIPGSLYIRILGSGNGTLWIACAAPDETALDRGATSTTSTTTTTTTTTTSTSTTTTTTTTTSTSTTTTTTSTTTTTTTTTTT